MDKLTKQTNKTPKICKVGMDLGIQGAKVSVYALLGFSLIATVAAVVGDLYDRKKQRQKINTFNQRFKKLL